jgi:hypothetical protein
LSKPPLEKWYQPTHFFSVVSTTTMLLENEEGYRYDVSNSLNLPVWDNPYSLTGYGFIARIAEGSGSRYARIHVMHENGAFLRGESPNRYVVLTISMGFPGVPFA